MHVYQLIPRNRHCQVGHLRSHSLQRHQSFDCVRDVAPSFCHQPRGRFFDVQRFATPESNRVNELSHVVLGRFVNVLQFHTSKVSLQRDTHTHTQQSHLGGQAMLLESFHGSCSNLVLGYIAGCVALAKHVELNCAACCPYLGLA